MYPQSMFCAKISFFFPMIFFFFFFFLQNRTKNLWLLHGQVFVMKALTLWQLKKEVMDLNNNGYDLTYNQRTNGPVNAHLRPEIYTNKLV